MPDNPVVSVLHEGIRMSRKDANRPRVDQETTTSEIRAVDGTPVNISNIIVNPSEALVDSISTALTELLGTRAKEAIYDQLARELSLAREEIPTHLDEFREVLKTNFGAAGALIERCIARRLYETLGWKFLDVTGFGLNEHFEFVKGIAERAQKMNSDYFY
jgi:hypothetical protein